MSNAGKRLYFAGRVGEVCKGPDGRSLMKQWARPASSLLNRSLKTYLFEELPWRQIQPNDVPLLNADVTPTLPY